MAPPEGRIAPAAGLAVAIAQATFQARHDIDMSRLEFTGLCTYLAVLIDWDYEIEEKELDKFIFLHDEFKRAQLFDKMSYHEWFIMIRDCAPFDNPELTITRRLLKQICDENPYTHRFTMEKMGAIVGAIHIHELSNQQIAAHRFQQFDLGSWKRVEIPFVYAHSADNTLGHPKIGEKVAIELTEFRGRDAIRLVQGARFCGYVRQFAIEQARRFVGLHALVYRWDPIHTTSEVSTGRKDYGRVVLWYEEPSEPSHS